MVEDEANQMIQEMAYRLQSQGFSISQFMEMTGQTVETLRDQYKADAEKKVKLRLVLEAICKVEGFEVSEEEIEEEFKKVAEQYGMEVDEVKKYIPAGDLAADAQIRKAYDLIQNSAVK
ncbi:MAG: trigger factor, partial [Erysipelotrichaceae bacterium]|nr:trigger factor [Erysipelotrichaceae bacterium]